MIKKCKRQVPSNKESKQGMVRFETGGMVEKRVRPSVKSKKTAHSKNQRNAKRLNRIDEYGMKETCCFKQRVEKKNGVV